MVHLLHLDTSLNSGRDGLQLVPLVAELVLLAAMRQASLRVEEMEVHGEKFKEEDARLLEDKDKSLGWGPRVGPHARAWAVSLPVLRCSRFGNHVALTDQCRYNLTRIGRPFGEVF